MNSNLEGPEEKGFFEKVKETIEHLWTGDKDESKEANEKVAQEVEGPAISPEVEKPIVKHKVTVVRNTTKAELKTSPAKAASKKKAAGKAVKANTNTTTAHSATTKVKTPTPKAKTPAVKVKAVAAKSKKAKTS